MAIGKPFYDNRPGIIASQITRICFLAMICAFQYWLLTSSMEAAHTHNQRIELFAFIASASCFILAAGIMIAGEIWDKKSRNE